MTKVKSKKILAVLIIAVMSFCVIVSAACEISSPSTVPTAPRNFMAIGGSEYVMLYWVEPSSDGGSSITRYEVSVDNGATWTTASLSTTHTFTGLTNGMEYTFKVRAVNAVGNGAEAFATATPVTVPTVPQNFTATAGDRRVTLSWTAPLSDGYSAISGYLVSKDNGATWITVTNNTTHTFTNLAYGTEHTFKVRAVNAVGNGAEAIATATPVTVPTAPQNFTATAENRQVTLSWTAPLSDGYSAITSYQISIDNGTTWIDSSSDTGHSFDDLTNRIFKVRAVNAIGYGAASTAFAIVPQISAGNFHSMSICSEGFIWTWGGNSNGQLGHGGTSDEHSPRRILTGHNNTELPLFIAISAGSIHSMALCVDGYVWTWGSGQEGRLGHGNAELSGERRPRRIILGHNNTALPAFVAISASSHSMALCENGNIWTWGHGWNNLLGHGGTGNELRPRMILTGFDDIKLPVFTAISAGRYSMALCVEGHIWTWGNGGWGLGHGGGTGDVFRPRRIMYVYSTDDTVIPAPQFTSVSTTDDFFGMALCIEGHIWTWGSGFRLGHGAENQAALRPRRIVLGHNNTQLPKFRAIDAGSFHSVAVCADGHIWSWGRGEHNRLGHGITWDVLYPWRISQGFEDAALPMFTAVSAVRHNIALCIDGYIWTFGDDFRGTLGHGDNSDAPRPRRIIKN